ncbi:hypothetical protein AB0G74_24045 [Streptomyces sp. NPDC020875]|uniref:hypothetical protein n=1 Tax=Streptomyces sp. NPDC020875 TaxID=3154898 RepID=UPI0034040468
MIRRKGQEECAECVRLRALLRDARRVGDGSLAADCRVLLRRHPAHDDVPVPATGTER